MEEDRTAPRSASSWRSGLHPHGGRSKQAQRSLANAGDPRIRMKALMEDHAKEKGLEAQRVLVL